MCTSQGYFRPLITRYVYSFIDYQGPGANYSCS